ncbi:MAG: LysR family transcriptional regulator, partial [Betaproteobacteria bacterium]
RAGTLDLAIALGADNDPAVKSHALFVDVIDGAMFARSHPLAERAMLEPQDLRGERLLVVSQAVQLFPKLFAHVERLGLRWEEIDSSDTVYAMVAAGIGWTLSVGGKRAGGFAQMAPPQGMVVRPVRGLNGTMPMMLKWRATETSRAVDNVARSLIAVFSGSSREAKRSTPPRGVRHITSPAAGAAGVPRGLELRQMQAFITTLEEKSLSRAALRVGLTQSGVSRQVRALERELECPLLQRGAHGVVPTIAGEVFGVEAAAVLGMVDAAITKARRAARGQEDFCVIGTIQPELTSGLVVRCLKQVAELYPRLEVWKWRCARCRPRRSSTPCAQGSSTSPSAAATLRPPTIRSSPRWRWSTIPWRSRWYRQPVRSPRVPGSRPPSCATCHSRSSPAASRPGCTTR